MILFSQSFFLLLFSPRLLLHLHSKLLFIGVLLVGLALRHLRVYYKEAPSEGLIGANRYFLVGFDIRLPAVMRDIVYKQSYIIILRTNIFNLSSPKHIKTLKKVSHFCLCLHSQYLLWYLFLCCFRRNRGFLVMIAGRMRFGLLIQQFFIIIVQMDIQSSEQSQAKNTKLIDGNFVIDLNNKLGEGSYSQVYISWLKNNPAERYACKVISKIELDKQISEKKGDNNTKMKLKNYIIKRIKTEVEIGHKINHPNIVRFVYFSETTRNIYIFMELCDINLEKFIMTRGALPQAAALPLFRDIVDAACVLYDRNITHRDIKAQNILIKGTTAKLADFGFAKELREKDMQQDGTGVGTILYMAPQLILHDKPQYSIRCDVWSIGVVMYYVLYGNVPWDKNQTLKSFQLSLKKPIDFPNTVPLSVNIKNLISKMLIFKDEERINIKDVKLVIDQMLNYG